MKQRIRLWVAYVRRFVYLFVNGVAKGECATIASDDKGVLLLGSATTDDFLAISKWRVWYEREPGTHSRIFPRNSQ